MNIYIYIYIHVYFGGWGVVPTGKSISVSVAVALRACEAACRHVRDNGSLGAGPKNWKFPGVSNSSTICSARLSGRQFSRPRTMTSHGNRSGQSPETRAISGSTLWCTRATTGVATGWSASRTPQDQASLVTSPSTTFRLGTV